jgi:hypothetical protein
VQWEDNRLPVCDIDAGGGKLVLDPADYEASLVLVIGVPISYLSLKIITVIR